MRTIVNIMLCHPNSEDPEIEVRLDDPSIVPAIFDTIAFEDEFEDDLCGRVTARKFRFLPHCIDVSIIAEIIE